MQQNVAQPDDFLTTADVATRCRVSEYTARRWASNGTFPNASRVGRSYLIPAKDLEAVLASKRVRNESRGAA